MRERTISLDHTIVHHRDYQGQRRHSTQASSRPEPSRTRYRRSTNTSLRRQEVNSNPVVIIIIIIIIIIGLTATSGAMPTIAAGLTQG